MEKYIIKTLNVYLVTEQWWQQASWKKQMVHSEPEIELKDPCRGIE